MIEVTPWCIEHCDDVATLFRAYVSRKQKLAFLDFDDLLLFWRYAVQHDVLGEKLGAAVDHVLVDEFQDVNLLQLDVLRGLRRSDPRLTLVGDDAQAIYGFRGASPRYLLDAETYFENLTTITLNANYRSTAPILDVANALAQRRARRIHVGSARRGCDQRRYATLAHSLSRRARAVHGGR